MLWPVLPETPSSLGISIVGNSAKLTWEVHGGNTTGIVVERQIDGGLGKGSWMRVAKLPNTATEYSDFSLKKGDRAAYRVRAINSNGESAYSNIARN